MSSEITEEALDDIKCTLCGDDTCCPDCSFIDTSDRLMGVCHDCGEEINYGDHNE